VENKMDLVFLAAGFATRLEPLTINKPKHLLPVRNGKFVDRLMDQISKVEKQFDRKVLITNDRYKDGFLKWQKETPLEIEVFSDGVRTKEEKLGATGDLLYLIKKANLENDMLVLAMDFIFEDFDFKGLIDFVYKKNASVLVVRQESDMDALRAGSCVELDKKQKVTRFEEKPKEPFSDLYGVPYYFIRRKDLSKVKKIPKELWDNCGQIAVQIAKESELFGFKVKGDYFHMTTLADYNRIKEM